MKTDFVLLLKYLKVIRDPYSQAAIMALLENGARDHGHTKNEKVGIALTPRMF